MQVHEYAKYMNVLHELALIEDALRTSSVEGDPQVRAYAIALLWVHF